jgi:hypothetical protein
MRQASITVTLDAEELTYTREIIEPLLDSTDMATTIAVLFGDAAAESLGFRKHGLSARAGLQLAASGLFENSFTSHGPEERPLQPLC